MLSHVRLLCSPWTVASQASHVHGIVHASILEWAATFPTSGNLPDQGVNPTSLASPAVAGVFFTTTPLMTQLFKKGLLKVEAKKKIEVESCAGIIWDLFIHELWDTVGITSAVALLAKVNWKT